MSLDIEKIAERLLAKIQKTIPKNADGTPTEAFEKAQALTQELKSPLESYLDLYVGDFTQQAASIKKIEEDPIAKIIVSNLLRDSFAVYYMRVKMICEPKLKELAVIHSVLTDYIHKHNIQEDESLWKVNEILEQSIRLAWAKLKAGAPSDLDIFMREIEEIKNACATILPALEQDSRVVYLYNSEKKKEKQRKKIGKENQKNGCQSDEVRRAEADKEKALKKVRQLLENGTYSQRLAACRHVCKTFNGGKGLLKSNGEPLNPQSLATAYRKKYGTKTKSRR